MKKFCATLYFVAMSLLVLSLSGCGGSTVGNISGESETTKDAQSRRMAITSPVFKRGGTYSIFRGDQVGASVNTAKYYLAPVTRGTEDITMNLEYSSAVSQDLPFMITDSDDMTVLFYYNPKGTGQDTTTADVFRVGGITQKQKYTNLTLTGSSIENASVEFDEDGVIDIVLNADGTATVGGSEVPEYDLVWHADPQHPAQYWTSGDTELDEDAYEAAITSTVEGVYIARDVRYTPNTLEFTTSQTATKDEDTEYVVYYDSSASAVKSAIAELGETYGEPYSTDKYIFASLPQQVAGMGGGMPADGGQGGNPPDGGQGGNPPAMPSSFSASATDTSSIPAFATMTHSASDAYKNPVLHITEAGTYRLSGKWHGQIWIEVGAKAQHQVGLILNGVEVSCDVAPALVFYKVYKWAEDNGYDDQTTLSANNLWRDLDDEMISSDGYYEPGAIVEIADGTTNSFTGANVYRLLELCPKLDDDDNPKYSQVSGSNISEQEKMYKLDGAFHSRRTLVIGGGSAGTGKLTITSTTCEGLDSEMHMLVTGGNITVTAPDDGINVNEDYVSVFVMNDGNLTISSTGGDGIDSNGWISFKGGKLNITAGSQSQNSAGEAGLDAENGVYIYDDSAYTWTAVGSSTPGQDQQQQQTYSIIPVTETVQVIGDTTFTLFPSVSSILRDTEGSRNIPTSGDTFPLVHKVNDFAGITTK